MLAHAFVVRLELPAESGDGLVAGLDDDLLLRGLQGRVPFLGIASGPLADGFGCALDQSGHGLPAMAGRRGPPRRGGGVSRAAVFVGAW